MAKDKASLAKRAKMLMWTWIVLWVVYIVAIGITPLVVDVDGLAAVVGILIILLPLVLLVFFIWSLVVIVQAAKETNSGLGLYLALSIIIAGIGIPYSLWDLGKKLQGGKSEIKPEKAKKEETPSEGK